MKSPALPVAFGATAASAQEPRLTTMLGVHDFASIIAAEHTCGLDVNGDEIEQETIARFDLNDPVIPRALVTAREAAMGNIETMSENELGAFCLSAEAAADTMGISAG